MGWGRGDVGGEERKKAGRGKQPFSFITEQVQFTTDTWLFVTVNCREAAFSLIINDLLKQPL